MDKHPNSVLLTTSYFGSIQYYSKIAGYSNIIIETHENYQKQSFRNRCQILTANGVMPLTVPVVRPKGNHTPIQDVLVDYATNWQRIHFKAIESAYRTAAYYEHYIEEIIPLFEQKERFLFDLNIKAHKAVMGILGISKGFTVTSKFEPIIANSIDDYRYSIHPKQQKHDNDDNFCAVSYFQVFSDRFPFVANLSIIDLVMNLGPDSYSILGSSILAQK